MIDLRQISLKQTKISLIFSAIYNSKKIRVFPMLWGSLIVFFAWTFFSCIVPTTMRPFSGVKSSAMVKVRSISFWLYSLVICGSFFAATMVYMLPFQGLSLSSSLPAKKTANSYLSLPFPVFHVLVLSLLCRDENPYFFRKWWFFNAWMFKSEPLNWVLKNLLYFLSHHLSCLLPQPIFQTYPTSPPFFHMKFLF